MSQSPLEYTSQVQMCWCMTGAVSGALFTNLIKELGVSVMMITW